MSLSNCSEQQLIWSAGSLYTFLFIWTFPQHLLIIDEWFYLKQGISYAQGTPFFFETDVITGLPKKTTPGVYPIGVPFFLSALILLFGLKAVFLQGFISILGSLYFLTKTLLHLDYNPIFALLVFVFFPSALLSRTLMSGMPSLLFMSCFFFLFTMPSKNTLVLLLTGLVGGLTVLFREPNILIILPFVIGFVIKNHVSKWSWVILGLTIAGFIRLFLSNWAFGDPFFTKDPGIEFSFSALFYNTFFYLPFLMICIPLGLVAIKKYQGPFLWEITIGSGLFIGLYLLYNYTGIEYSGIKSIILGPRFFIAALPLFVIAIGAAYQKQIKGFIFIKKHFFLVAVASILSTQLIGGHFDKAQHKIVESLDKNTKKVHLMANLSVLPKLLNPISVNYPIVDRKDSLLIHQILERDTFMYVETAIRRDNEFAFQHTYQLNEDLYSFLKKYCVEQIYEGLLPDRTIIQQFKIQHCPLIKNDKSPTF